MSCLDKQKILHILVFMSKNIIKIKVMLEEEINIYDMSYDFITDNIRVGDLNNKLFCTFTNLDSLDRLLEDITSKYTIMYNKMFVLEIIGKDEYVVTYNVDQGNINSIPDNTILVHRKEGIQYSIYY